ncbi:MULTISPECIES: hypothetical protein [unclassified Paenibacillus]|nr:MULTISPECIES: hypothetical protein [unclassified Paenibacillus]
MKLVLRKDALNACIGVQGIFFYFMYLAVERLFLDKIKDKRVRVAKTNT